MAKEIEAPVLDMTLTADDYFWPRGHLVRFYDPNQPRVPKGSGDQQFAVVPGVIPREDTSTKVPSGPWRFLTLQEKRAQVDVRAARMETASSGLAKTMTRDVGEMIADLKKRIEKGQLGVDPRTARDVRNLRCNQRMLAQLRLRVYDTLLAEHEWGLKDARREVREAKKVEEFAAKKIGLFAARARAFFKNKSFYITGLIEDALIAQAKNTLFRALKGDKTSRQVQFELDDDLKQWQAESVVNLPHRIETIARTNIAEAQEEGRFALYTDPDLDGFVTGYTYSAVMDNRTRDSHAAWDGTSLPADHPAWFQPDRRPPNGFNCRCQLVPVTIADDVVWTPDDQIRYDVDLPDPGFK